MSGQRFLASSSGSDGRGFHNHRLDLPGTYRITAVGGQGGGGASGGRGAKVTGLVEVKRGEGPKYVTIVVGRAGPTASSIAGGGGGSFVFWTDDKASRAMDENSLIVAAGGGGGYGVGRKKYRREDVALTTHGSAEASGNRGLSSDSVDGSLTKTTAGLTSSDGAGGAGAGIVVPSSIRKDDVMVGKTPARGAKGGGRSDTAKDFFEFPNVMGAFGGGGGAKLEGSTSLACGGGAGYRGGGGASTASFRGDVGGGGGGSKNNTTSEKEEWSGRDLEVVDSPDGRGDGYVDILLTRLHVTLGDDLSDPMYREADVVRDVRNLSDDDVKAVYDDRKASERDKTTADQREVLRGAIRKFRGTTFEHTTVQEALAADRHRYASQVAEFARVKAENDVAKREVHKTRQLALSDSSRAFRLRVWKDGLLLNQFVMSLIAVVVGVWKAEFLSDGLAMVLMVFAIVVLLGTVGFTALFLTARNEMRWKRWYRRMGVVPDGVEEE